MQKPLARNRFEPGDWVRVQKREPPPHCRTPSYTQGRIGQVAAFYGIFHDPEGMPANYDRPKQPLYRIKFEQTALWSDYTGALGDSVGVDIFEHWLEPAAAPAPRSTK